MLLFLIPAIIVAAATAWGAIKDAFGSLFPSAPESGGEQSPYTPPYTGGQCNKMYTVYISIKQGGEFQPEFPVNLMGAIGEYSNTGGNSWCLPYNGGEFCSTSQGKPNIRVVPQSGSDDCGNLPNPNPSVPDIVPSTPLVQGAPLVVFNPFLAALAAALAAAKAAASALDAIKAVADAVKAIGDALKDLLDWLKDKDKKDKEKKDLHIHKYGSISEDGYLRLFPDAVPDGFEPLYIHLEIKYIPRGKGKYFGKKSPHYYRYMDLGYIAFVSPSLGVLSVCPIEFAITSVPIPDNSIGFYYHFGFGNSVKANAGLFYLKQQAEP